MSSQGQMSIYLSAELTSKMVSVAQDLACRVVRECGSRYNFDADEAIRELGLSSVEVVRQVKSRSMSKKLRSVVVERASFPLPFNGECNDDKCSGLRLNNGLYTQCQVARKGEKSYCKTCEDQAVKNVNGKPDYGTIEDRLAVGIFEYVDPRGNKPVGYKKIMKKLKLSEEQVLEEAGKLNIIINPQHFEEVEEVKKGRKPNPLKEVKVKAEGKKGRPKKSKKVLEIEGDSDDLFASLVASASSSSEEVEVVSAPVSTPVLAKKAVKSLKSEEEKEAERLKKEEEKAVKKAEKEAKLAAEKAEKEAKLAAEKAEKEAKKEAEKAEKEAKLAAEKAEKEAKLAAEKAEKEAKKEAEKAAKESKKKPSSPKKEAKVEEEEEADVVKKIEFEGKKYLKSKKTGIVYDYKKYVEEEEQVVVGKWNEEKSKIDFQESEEEEEEEYDE